MARKICCGHVPVRIGAHVLAGVDVMLVFLCVIAKIVLFSLPDESVMGVLRTLCIDDSGDVTTSTEGTVTTAFTTGSVETYVDTVDVYIEDEDPSITYRPNSTDYPDEEDCLFVLRFVLVTVCLVWAICDIVSIWCMISLLHGIKKNDPCE